MPRFNVVELLSRNLHQCHSGLPRTQQLLLHHAYLHSQARYNNQDHQHQHEEDEHAEGREGEMRGI